MIVTVVVTALTVVVALLVTLCARGLIGRNPVVGIRIPAFFESDQTWQLGHQDAQAPVWVAAAASIVVTVATMVSPAIDENAAALFNCGILVLGLVVGAVRGTRDLRRRTRRP